MTTPASRPGRRPRSVVSPVLTPTVPVDERRRVVPVLPDERSPVLVELDLAADPDTAATRRRFLQRYRAVFRDGGGPPPRAVADSYLACVLTPAEIQELIAADRGPGARPTVHRVWPDYALHAHMDRSTTTIKADAAARTFAASGRGVTWAVLDSGVDAEHPHFADGTLTGRTARWHRDFTDLVVTADAPDGDVTRAGALADAHGHGTHVAGIIAGAAPDGLLAVATRARSTDGLPGSWVARVPEPGRRLCSMAPQAGLVSLKVLASDGDDVVTTSSAVIAALFHVRQVLNNGGRSLTVHGVNLSIGCRWDPTEYAAGQSPLCREVDLLVGSGVVVVVSAGNDGASGTPDTGSRGVLASITDPGNAAEAITVGSTHRDSPHRYGVTYSSSKGPTLDGRAKPDLLAPGEQIASCASGRLRAQLGELAPPGCAAYAEDSGTSMSAAHISGAIAAFLSVRREFVGRPREVKDLFTRHAISLGREPAMEGHGLVDLMRVLSMT